jgi:hypothetical protein
MTEFSFGLVVSGADFSDDDVINRLVEAGLDDASFAVRDGGHVAYFDREGPDFFGVLREAVADVEAAMPDARVCGLDAPDFMTASGVAESSGRTRQSVFQHIHGQRGGGFPPPVLWVDGDRPLWLKSDVSVWSRSLADSDQTSDTDLRWPGVASGVFHLARASSGFDAGRFAPAMTFLIDRYMALGRLDEDGRHDLSRQLRELADRVDGAGVGQIQHPDLYANS